MTYFIWQFCNFLGTPINAELPNYFRQIKRSNVMITRYQMAIWLRLFSNNFICCHLTSFLCHNIITLNRRWSNWMRRYSRGTTMTLFEGFANAIFWRYGFRYQSRLKTCRIIYSSLKCFPFLILTYFLIINCFQFLILTYFFYDQLRILIVGISISAMLNPQTKGITL